MSGVYNVPEFYKLGLGDPYPISAVNVMVPATSRLGVVKDLPVPGQDEDKLDEIPEFAIVGRPFRRQVIDNQRLYPGLTAISNR